MPQSTFYEAAGQAMRADATRRRLAQVADRVAATVRRLAQAEDVQVTVTRSGGTRPKGRPYERVAILASTEWGASGVERRRILSRAASASARTGRR